MAALFSYYSGVLTDALTIGAIIGALAGVVAFTASSANEGVHRVMVGFIIGGVIMGAFQGLMLADAAGVGMGRGSVNPLFSSNAGTFGGMVYVAVIRTIQAALAGGLLMVASLAPFKAFKGAMAGVIIGVIAAFLAWGVLQYVDAAVPVVIFYALILGLVLFIIENLPTSRA